MQSTFFNATLLRVCFYRATSQNIMYKSYLLSLYFLLGTAQLWGQVSGKVSNERGEPLPGAYILLLPDSALAVADGAGGFSFPRPKPGVYAVEVSFLGFDTQRKEFAAAQKPIQLNIVLSGREQLLQTVVITADHAKQENTLSSEHLMLNFIAQQRGGSFAQSIEKLPGLSAITVGAGIAKPVIRGLSFNRIIVNSQGIKQEGQQWGADHGLEMDQFDVEQVEIIKGPASLQYGSDGLGGVINILPGAIPQRNSLSGSVMGLFKTNNSHIAGSAFVAANANDWFATARFSRQDYASFRVPAENFVFNGFELPIYNNTLLNTGGRENNFNINLGRKTGRGITRVAYSLYDLEAGLFPGAVGIPRSYTLTPRDNNREISVPKQTVAHHKLSLSRLVFWDANHAEINFGYQYNLRREFSFPENHNRFLLNDPNDRLALQLDLQTFSSNGHLELNPTDTWKTVFGFNAQYQTNRRSGFEFLLPDFRTFRGGVFTIHEKQLNPRLTGIGGLRFDAASNHTTFFEQPFFDSGGTVLGFQRAPRTNHLFFNVSASGGLNVEAVPDQLYLKVNLGKSFRAPYPNETSSDGVHHGNFRHELGTTDLRSEHGYQLDLGAEWESQRFTASWAGYLNYFDQYIYLKPSGRFVFRPDAGQTYQYVQNDAVYVGFELDAEWRVRGPWSLHGAAEYVWNRNIDESRPLPFTPPPSVLLELNFKPTRSGALQNLALHLSSHYYFAKTAATVAQNEPLTPDYNLLEAGVNFALPIGRQKVHWSLQGQNLLNRRYFNPLSRYRILNLPEQGRNVMLSVKFDW